MAPQGRLQQGGVIVIARQQRHGQPGSGEQLSELHIASPALVLAEITADQQQIRDIPKGGKSLLQAMAELSQGGAAPVATPPLTKKMGITELQNPERMTA
jgi:hypothetical protein